MKRYFRLASLVIALMLLAVAAGGVMPTHASSPAIWAATGSLNTARYYHTATLLPTGKVLVAGGHDSHNDGTGFLASAELYDPTTGAWTATGSLSAGRYQHTATLLPSGKVLVAGGYGDTGLLASAELYGVQGPPSVSSPTATSVTDTTATLGGNVTSDGGAAVTERGSVYAPTATNSNPQIGGTGVTKVAASAAGTGTFTVNVSGLTPSTGYSYAAYATNSVGTSYTSTATFSTIASSADLSVSLTDSPDPVNKGGTITYAIGVANAGPSTASSVSLSDTIPANTTFQSLTPPSGWNCTQPAPGGTGAVSCTATSLASGGSASFSLVVQVAKGVSSGATISDSASVSSSTADPNSANNSATTTTSVVASGGGTTADLAVSETNSPPNGTKVGNSVTFKVTVKNTGPGTAAVVSLRGR